MKVLITGISGALGRMVATKLLSDGHQVIGIDRRPWPDAPNGLEVFRVDIRKRPAQNVLRTQRPDALIHMATTIHYSTRFEERARINLGGTRKLIEECHHHGIKHFLFVGRHTVYGAAPDAPLYHTEDEPPLAVSTFPELADLAAADLYAASALWRYPDLNMAVLRLVYTLGSSRRGTLASFLSGRKAPMVMGFDPLFQFMHERDAAAAICLALEKKISGIYNVAGPQPVPLSLLCKVSGLTPIPIPEFLYSKASGRFGFRRQAPSDKAHVKYPVVVDDSRFRKETGFEHSLDEVQTMEAFRWNR